MDASPPEQDSAVVTEQPSIDSLPGMTSDNAEVEFDPEAAEAVAAI
jgi:hypothetical protein